MAGDWIKIEENTPDKPEVWQMAAALGIDADSVTGKLVRVWVWAGRNCNADGVTNVTAMQLIDRIAGVTNFAQAMLSVGWLVAEGDSLTFARFNRHTSQTAKERALTNRRVAKTRKSCNARTVTDVTPAPLQKPLPEKRREEKNEGIIENPAGADPCTEEDAWRYADGIMLGLSREGVALWHANRQSGGWTIARNNGSMQPISNWQADLRSSKTWIQAALSRARQANDFQRASGKAPRPSRAGPGTAADPCRVPMKHLTLDTI